MSDPLELREFDPYVLLHDERARLDRFFEGCRAADWQRPTRCEGWTVKDLLGHLAASEEYNHACLRDGVAQFLEHLRQRGATDLHALNALRVSDRADRSAEDVLREWREASTQTHRQLRHRDGQSLNTAAGPYPVRLQAWHLVAELATHADDCGAPVDGDEAASRTEWRAAFSRFVLAEEKQGLRVAADSGHTRVQSPTFDVTLDDAALVEVVAARAPADSPLTEPVRSALSMQP